MCSRVCRIVKLVGSPSFCHSMGDAAAMKKNWVYGRSMQDMDGGRPMPAMTGGWRDGVGATAQGVVWLS